MKDKYDLAIEYLTKHPEQISNAWFNPESKFGCLFQFVCPTGKRSSGIGYLSMIRYNPKISKSYWPELQDKIANDERIPKYVDEYAVDHLQVFAEWQRFLDANYRNQS